MHISYLPLQTLHRRYEPQLSAAAQRVIASGCYLRGTETAAFESDFAAYLGAEHCVGTANGLDALTLILMAMRQLEGWGDEDEVVVPAMTFFATALAVRRSGLRPVLCDVDAAGGMSPVAARAAIGSRTRALLPVHLYGRIVDIAALTDLAHRHGLRLVEDAAQAHGARCGAQRAGTFGDAAAFSFYPGKNLGALGDGGAVVTHHSVLAERVRALANYGAPVKYCHEYAGMNSRLDEIQAAMLRVKLARLDTDNARRRAIALRIDAVCGSDFVHPFTAAEGERNVFHIYPLLCSRREEMKLRLERAGIDTLVHYPIPLHRQPALPEIVAPPGTFPMAERWADEELSLPVHPAMTDAEVDYLVDTLRQM